MSLTTKRYVISPLAMVLFAALAMPVSAQDASLPGGANTLNETHGDWSVACVIQTGQDGVKTKLCALSQQQISGQTRQRVLAVELRPEGDSVTGALVLPFGLALQQGVTYQLDDGAVGSPQHFRTCLPAGCVIDIAFDARMMASLKSGNALKVNATADGGQGMAFSVSLTGFSSAYDRVVELLR